MIIAAAGFNEQEFLTVKNKLEKAGYSVFIASDAHGLCKGMGGLKVKADVSFFNMNVRSFAGVVLIGGTGIVNYFSNQNILSTVKRFFDEGKIVGAICGAPVILARAGILSKRPAVCFPDLKHELEREGAVYTEEPVVEYKNIVTAANPASAGQFAEHLIEKMKKGA